MTSISLSRDRFFDSDSFIRGLALELYEMTSSMPLVCPHGHVDPRLFADPNATFGNPANLLIIPDHYVTRMLYSQGIPLESLLPSPMGRGVEDEGGAHPQPLFP